MPLPYEELDYAECEAQARVIRKFSQWERIVDSYVAEGLPAVEAGRQALDEVVRENERKSARVATKKGEVDRDTFRNKDCPRQEALNWAVDHTLYNDVSPEDAPSAFAYIIWKQLKSDPGLMGDLMRAAFKLIQPNKQDDESDRAEADMAEAEEIVLRYYDAPKDDDGSDDREDFQQAAG